MRFSASQIGKIAIKLLGDPNRSLSSKRELRFGNHCSLSVDLAKAAFFDHERGQGGGIFDLIRREGHDPHAWLARHGFEFNASSRRKPNGAARTKRAYGFRIVAVNSYVDENGAELFQSCRMENDKIAEDGKPEKKFTQRRAKDDGKYAYRVKGVRQVPYRLPQLIEACAHGETIFIPEGEKCVNSLCEIGLAATCNAGGAGKWPDEITPYLKGADVVILPDNDDRGRKHAKLIAQKLLGIAKRIRVLQLPNLRDKGDIADWRDAGGTREALLRLVEDAPDYSGEADNKGQPENLTDAEFDAEINRLAALPKIRYERERTSAASALRIPVSRLDKLVKDECKNTPQRQGRPLKFPEPEPWPEPVDGAALLSEVTAAIKRYVVLTETQAHTVALWVLHSCTPRLAITSPEKRCGKTLLLDVVAGLVQRPLAAANITPPSIFRTIELARPTLLIDEADTFLSANEELRGVLNSGHRAGGQVIRTVGEDFEPRTFATFSPCAIAMIGNLPPTLDDRSIHISMRRKVPGEKVGRFRRGRDSKLDELARKAVRWTADNAEALRGADPKMPDGIENRQADNWEPLFAIADAVGGEWPEAIRKVAIEACGSKEDDSHNIRLLADIQIILHDGGNTCHFTSAGLVSALIALPDRGWDECNRGRPLTQKPASLSLSGCVRKPSGSDRKRRRCTKWSISTTHSRVISFPFSNRNNRNIQ